MKGSEISCGVYKFKDKIIALPITEIISENNFLIMKQNTRVSQKKLHQQESMIY